MIDTGVVCRGTFDGSEVLGIRAQLAQALHHARADRHGARTCFQAARSGSSDRRARRRRHHAGAGADPPPRHQHRPPPSAGAARFSEWAERAAPRFHSDGPRHRRRRTGRQGLENADERARWPAAAFRCRRCRRRVRPTPRFTGAYARIREQFHVSIAKFEASRSGSAASRRPPICSTPRAA